MSNSKTRLSRAMTNDVPDWGTPEFVEWWESQYDFAESHNVKRRTISELEWASGFVGK